MDNGESAYAFYEEMVTKNVNKQLEVSLSFILYITADDVDNMDVSSHIPLDDGMPVDFGAIEVIQCLIEQHNPIFTNANDRVWR